ncbi:MAG: antitoxin Xre/MbcA/ParS toxin-binding domain-containing protein [Verrucomicrobiota bacterium]
MKYKQCEAPAHLAVEEAKAAGYDNPGLLVERILAGLPVEEFDALRNMLGLSVEAMAAKIGVSVATLHRRRTRHQPLDRDHSDRLMRYARLYWLSLRFFDGKPEAARRWLQHPAHALGGASPLDFAETEMGAREVEDLIGRLEYGVYV